MPEPDGDVWGEVYEMSEPEAILPALDDIEGFRPGQPDQSLYTRELTEVTLADGTRAVAGSTSTTPRSARRPGSRLATTSSTSTRGERAGRGLTGLGATLSSGRKLIL